MSAIAVQIREHDAPQRQPKMPQHTGSTMYGLDYAEPDKDALSIERLEQWFSEIRDQPNFRRECDIDADYYDGHQLTAEILEKMREKGFPPIIENLCRPTIDAVLGLEAKTRTDYVVRHDNNDRWEDVSLALSVKIKEVERESGADKACSDGYGALIKCGLGWIEVSREIIPGRYPYRVRYVHRREIAWDWRAKEPDLSDARYLVRRQWFDVDQLVAYFPRHARLLEAIGSNWNVAWWDDMIQTQNTGLARSYELERATTIEEYEFRDTLRRRLCLYEVWYRTWKATAMLHLPDGRWVEYDKKNRQHVVAVAKGWLIPQILPMPKVRLSFWVGPHRLIDIPSPYGHEHFPYVPLFGYREDRSGAPYGLIRNMRHQQDEVNARKAKMMWLLSAKQVIADSDAVTDHNLTREEVGRPDAYIMLNANRKPTSKLEIKQEIELSEQQFKVYENAKQALQDVAGVYQALLGKDSKAESGVAINSLIEQGTTTLAEINDNYRYARRKVGELLLACVKEDVTNGTTIAVGEGPQRREVTLNQPANDEFGPHLLNDVKRAGVKVVLDEIPTTPTYRQQQFAQLTELVKSLPEQIQGYVLDFVIEASDFPQRRAMAERVRKFLGIEGSQIPKTPAERKAMEAAALERERRARLQQRGEEAEVRKVEGEAEKAHADARKVTLEAEQMGSGDAQLAASLQLQLEQVTEAAQEMIADLEKKIAEIESQLSGQTDAELRAAVDIAKANLQAKVDAAMERLNKRIDELSQKVKGSGEKKKEKATA
jgi:hypothetical protein